MCLWPGVKESKMQASKAWRKAVQEALEEADVSAAVVGCRFWRMWHRNDGRKVFEVLRMARPREMHLNDRYVVRQVWSADGQGDGQEVTVEHLWFLHRVRPAWAGRGVPR